MSIFGWIVMGLLAGWVAKALVPGRQPGGWIVTTVIGIVGAALGGWIGTQLGWGSITGFDLRSFGLALVGGVVFLLVLGAIRGR
jgi:uncharacterized membrane protein YeaQ/YmgE (transglycosylase-associated protein family)